MIYCVDLDGVLCNTEAGDYPNAKPIPENIEKTNKLYKQGHTVNIFTARGSSSKKDWTDLTQQQLKCWGVKYNNLLMGKPSYDFIVDDRAINVKDWSV